MAAAGRSRGLARAAAPRERAETLQASRSRYADLYDFAPVACLTFDQSGAILELNLATAAMLGRPRSSLVGLPVTRAFGVLDEPALWGHVARCIEARRTIDVELRVAIPGRGPAILQMITAALPDPAGRLVVRAAMIDVTSRRRSERGLRFLGDLAVALGGAPEQCAVLRRAVRAAVPAMAELCLIELVPREGRPRRVASCMAEPSDPGLIAALERRFPELPGIERLVARALDRGVSSLAREFSGTDPFHAAPDLGGIQLLRDLGVRSVMVVPLVVRGRREGVLVLATRGGPGPLYEDDDLRIGEELARRVAMALENAELHEEARRATQARDEMLAVVAHDLRNAITGLLLNARILGAAELDGRACRAAKAIGRLATSMQHFIGDLLDTALIDSGRLKLDPRPVDARALVEDAVQPLLPLAAERSVEIRLEAEEGIVVNADPERVLQVLGNLLDNAMKHGGRGEITVRVEATGGEALFSVRDHGPGIAPEQLGHVFDRYWQSERGARSKGAGLGLSIARGIVEAHGGRIGVESAPGEGSTFFFTLPRR